MKVLLKVDVDNIGYAGEVHKVADGYGRNYLIPQGLAVKASSDVMKQAEFWRKRAEARREEMRAEYEALSERITAVTLTFLARASVESGRLYGSVTTNQIVDALNAELGTEIDRRNVPGEPLRELGTHKVVVRLSADYQPELTVIIESEDDQDEDVEEEIVEVDVVETVNEVEAEVEVSIVEEEFVTE